MYSKFWQRISVLAKVAFLSRDLGLVLNLMICLRLGYKALGLRSVCPRCRDAKVGWRVGFMLHAPPYANSLGCCNAALVNGVLR